MRSVSSAVSPELKASAARRRASPCQDRRGSLRPDAETERASRWRRASLRSCGRHGRDLPMPLTMTRPLTARIVSMARRTPRLREELDRADGVGRVLQNAARGGKIAVSDRRRLDRLDLGRWHGALCNCRRCSKTYRFAAGWGIDGPPNHAKIMPSVAQPPRRFKLHSCGAAKRAALYPDRPSA